MNDKNCRAEPMLGFSVSLGFGLLICPCRRIQLAETP